MQLKEIIKLISNKITSSHVRVFGWSFFAAFIVTVGLPLLFFFYLFNPDDVRKMIVNQVNSDQYVVKINGDVEPKTWHGLTLFIADTAVYDKKGHEVLHINDASYQLSWLYLIIGKYKVRRISLKGVTLTKNASYDGLINYNYFHNSEFDNLKYLFVSNLKLNNESGEELFNDANLKISNIDQIPEFNFRLNVPKINTSLSFLGEFTKQGKELLFDSLDVKFTNDRINLDAQSSASFDLSAQSLKLDNLNGLVSSNDYTGSINIESSLITINNAEITKFNSTIRTKNIDNVNQTINLSMSNLTTHDYINYVAGFLDASLNTTYDNHDIVTNVNSNNLHFDTDLNVNKQAISVSYNATCTESSNFPNSAIVTGTFSHDSTHKLVTGAFTGLFKHSPMKFNLQYDYKLPVPNLGLQGSIESIDLNSSSDKPEDKVLPMYQDQKPFALTWLGKFNLNANMAINQISLHKLRLNNATANVQINESEIAVKNLKATMYNGKIQTDLSLLKHNDNYNFLINGNINNLDLQQAFKGMFDVGAIAGAANISMKTSSNDIKNFSDVYNKLTGSVLLNITNGGFNGIDFNLFLSPENLSAFMDHKTSTTQFTNLTANFNFKQGISESGVINFNSPTIKAKGNGLINFAENKINYDLLIQSSLPENPNKVSSVVIPVNVVGELFKPKIYIKNMKLNKAK